MKKGKLQKDGDKYRLPQNELEEISLKGVDTKTEIDVKFPLELEKYIKIPPRTIFVVAAAPGACKTAFLHNFLLRNMYHPMGLTLWTNDMTPEEILERFEGSGLEIPDPLPFKMYERDDAFGDVIDPDGISLIDYLDTDSDYYLVAAELTRIHRRLRTGMALVALQKNPHAETAMGGYPTLKRPKFYVVMDSTTYEGDKAYKLKFIKARGRRNSQVDPKGLEFIFQLHYGIRFWLKEVG